MMRKMKQWFAGLLAVAVAGCSALPMTALAAQEERPVLQFNQEGKFKILMIADAQDTDTPQKETIDLLEAALEKSKPDLVVFTGDNTNGNWPGVNEEKTKVAISKIIEPVDRRNIPFAVVYGNHDHEGGVSKETQMKMYQEYKTCLAVEGEDLTGCGNYNLLIKDSKGEKDIFNLWLMDSNPYAPEPETGYGYVAQDQIDWYERTSNQLKAQNGGTPMPSLLFQHIAVPQVYDLLTPVKKGTKDAVKGHNTYSDRYWIANPDLVKQGKLREGPCPPDSEHGQFASWKKQGDIVGAFFGHDHVNDFSGQVDGIWLTCCVGTGFYSYGNTHGVRTIELDEKDLSTFKSDIYYFEDLVSYKVKNLYKKNHGYSEYRRYFLPGVAIAGGVLAAAAVAGVVIAKIVKKKKAN